MAEENRDWGYRRIQGALSNLGYELARSTSAEILERHGIEPALERSRKTFLEGVSDATLGTDGGCGLLHRGNVDPTRAAANGLWMSQIGRNLTDAVDGILNGKRYLIHDRDPLFTAEFLGRWPPVE